MLRSAHLLSNSLAIGTPQRHAPERIADLRARLQQGGGYRFVVAVHRLELRAEGDARGAGQRGAIDEQIGLLAVGFGESVMGMASA
jgi:transcription-repair coupling factor (superfamily II helicase)